MSPLYSRLTEEELNRNKHGPCLLYTYDSALNFPVSSSLPGKFPDLSCCHARYEFLWHEHSDTLRFWVLLMTLKGTDGKLLWLEISTCNICSSVGCLNCNSTIGLRSIKFYTNNNYLLQNILGGATHNASRVTGRPMSYEKKQNNCNSLNDDLMHTGLCPLNKLMK